MSHYSKPTLPERIFIKAGIFILYPILVIPVVTVSLIVAFLIVVAIWPFLPFLEIVNGKKGLTFKFVYDRENEGEVQP